MKNLHSFVTLVLLAAVCVMGYLWVVNQRGENFDTNNGTAKSGLLKTEPEFRDKLAELRMQRDKVNRSVKRLENLKGETIAHLKSKGISSGDDYLKSSDPDVKYAVVNLKAWVAEIDSIKGQLVHNDNAITGVETMLDKIERQRISDEATLSDEEYLELQTIIVDLGERLQVETDFMEDEELGKLLDLEMTDSSD